MSVEHLSQIIGRVVIDTRFRALFYGDVDEALRGYDLTDHETKVLTAVANCSVIRTGISIAGFRYRQIEQSCDRDEGNRRG
jgi:hypothetical protein